jgi:hypothetical protein
MEEYKNENDINLFMMISKKYQLPSIGIVILLILISFLGYTFYADAEAIQQVSAEVETINRIEPKITSATLLFTINLTNPSSRNIHQLSSTFDIFIENNFVGTGSFSDHDIPAQTSTIKEISININYGGLADSAVDILKNWVKGQESTVRINGNITAAVLFGLTTASHEFTASSN